MRSSLYRVNMINRSGTITTGGTAQEVMAADGSRAYILIQNPSAESESLFFSFDATAVADSPSIELEPGQSYETLEIVPTGALSIIAATTGHKFTVKEA